jgi:hypothetical protein
MTITQISKIKVRRGTSDNLPENLDGGELAYSTDTRHLYIGNGSTDAPDHAPVLGKTEVLTEFSALILQMQADIAYLKNKVG